MGIADYLSGNLVRASDYNEIKDLVANIFGTGTGNTGYGGNSIGSFPVDVTDLTTIAVGEPITSGVSMPGEWLKLRNAIASVAAHQGTVLTDVLPAETDLEVGDKIAAQEVAGMFVNFENLASTLNASTLNSNRLIPSPSNMTTSTVLTDTRVNPWQSMIQLEFKVIFASHDEARWFFNTGGAISLSTTHTGGSGTAQTLDWKSLINGQGPYVFDSTDYFSLTNTYATIFSASGTGAYAANQWLIQAKYDDAAGPNGARGSMLKIRMTFLDNYAGAGDLIDGTINATINEARSVGVFPRLQPTYCITECLELFDQLVEFSTSFSANDVQRQNSGQQFVTTYTVNRTSGQGPVEIRYENKSNPGLQVWINGILYSPGQTVASTNMSAGNPSLSVTVTANAQNLLENQTRFIQLRAVSAIQNTLDNITFNTPASFSTNSRTASASNIRIGAGSIVQWGSVLNNYGVWDSNPADQFYNNTWTWNFPCNGTYRFSYACDNLINSGSVTWPGNSANISGNPGFSDVSFTFQIGVSVGTPEVGGGGGQVVASCENVRVESDGNGIVNGPPPGFIPSFTNPGAVGFLIELIGP